MKNKDGGPAFPYTNCEDHGICGAYGMTLRDYFANSAMQAELALWTDSSWKNYTSDIAAKAYLMADAMLKER